MGATYVVEHLVATAFDELDGKLYAAMFERSYESNVFPRTPCWSACAFGDQNQTVRRAVVSSADAEGGMLKGKGGNTTPTAFIHKWQDAFAHARYLVRREISIPVSNGYRGINAEQLPLAKEIAARFGLDCGSREDALILPNKPGQLAALAELVRERQKTGVLAWHALSFSDCSAEAGMPVHGKVTSTSGVEPPQVDVWLMPEAQGEAGGDRHHLLRIGGRVRQTGWAYSTVGRFICDVAADAEVARAGSAERLIRQMRTKMKAAQELPGGTLVVVNDPGPTASRWAREEYAILTGAFPSTGTDRVEAEIARFAESGRLMRALAALDESASFQLAETTQARNTAEGLAEQLSLA